MTTPATTIAMMVTTGELVSTVVAMMGIADVRGGAIVGVAAVSLVPVVEV